MWYAFHGYNNGKAINASQFDAGELNLVGMHGYPTEAQAEAKPNSVNIFQATIVNAAIDDANNARDVASAPGNAAKAVGGLAGGAAGDVLSAFTKWIGQSNIWVRGAEIVTGLLILYIGLKAVTAPPGATATQISKDTVKHVAKRVIKK